MKMTDGTAKYVSITPDRGNSAKKLAVVGMMVALGLSDRMPEGMTYVEPEGKP